MTRPPDPVFEAPWHAQAFALAVHLNESAAFTWSEWTETFGSVLAEHRLDGALNGGDDYFLAWVEALERICAARGLAEAGALATLKTRWERAFRATPHGRPVALVD